MHMVNMHEAKTHLSRLVVTALEGEEVVIAKMGKPLIRLTPYVPVREPRQPGALKGKIKIKADFDTLPDDFMQFFEPQK